MTNEEAIGRIRDHMDHHGIGHYPHLKIKEALDLAISALQSVGKDITAPTKNDHFREVTKMVPLTLEQLREMDGQPVWVETKAGSKFWAIVTNNCVSSEYERYLWIDEDTEYEKTWFAYAYHPAHIDREAQTAEWKRTYRSGIHAGNGYVCSNCDMWNNRPSWFCPSCGRAMTPEAWAELEKRLREGRA